MKSCHMQTGKRQKSILRISQLERISRLYGPCFSPFRSLCHVISAAFTYYQVWQPSQLQLNANKFEELFSTPSIAYFSLNLHQRYTTTLKSLHLDRGI